MVQWNLSAMVLTSWKSLDSAMEVPSNLNESGSLQISLPSTSVFFCPEKSYLQGPYSLAPHTFEKPQWAAGQNHQCLEKSSALPGTCELRNLLWLLAFFFFSLDWQHLKASDLLAMGNVTFKPLGAFYNLCGVGASHAARPDQRHIATWTGQFSYKVTIGIPSLFKDMVAWRSASSYLFSIWIIFCSYYIFPSDLSDSSFWWCCGHM